MNAEEQREHAVKQLAMFTQARDVRQWGGQLDDGWHPTWEELDPKAIEEYLQDAGQMVAAMELLGWAPTVEGTVTIPRPHVPYGPEHVSPDVADADYLRAAVRNIDHLSRGERLWGSNLTATVRKLLLDAAAALSPVTPESETER